MKNKNGFSIVEVTASIFLLLVIIGAGLYIHSKSSAFDRQPNNIATYKNPYPNNGYIAVINEFITDVEKKNAIAGSKLINQKQLQVEEPGIDGQHFVNNLISDSSIRELFSKKLLNKATIIASNSQDNDVVETFTIASGTRQGPNVLQINAEYLQDKWQIDLVIPSGPLVGTKSL